MRKAFLAAALALCFVPAGFSQTGGGGSVQSATIALTSAQLRQLYTAPIQIVAAPGPGQMLLPIAAVYQYKFGTAAYQNGGNLWLNFANDTGGNNFLQTFNSPVNASSWTIAFGFTTGAVQDVQANFANSALMVTNGGGLNFSGGDGTLTVTVSYIVVALQ
jgi:hypothetical protein